MRGFFFGEDLLEEVGVVGDEAVDAEVDEGADLFGVVGGPGDDAEAGSVEFGYVDGGVGAEEGRVEGESVGLARRGLWRGCWRRGGVRGRGLGFAWRALRRRESR